MGWALASCRGGTSWSSGRGSRWPPSFAASRSTGTLGGSATSPDKPVDRQAKANAGQNGEALNLSFVRRLSPLPKGRLRIPPFVCGDFLEAMAANAVTAGGEGFLIGPSRKNRGPAAP